MGLPHDVARRLYRRPGIEKITQMAMMYRYYSAALRSNAEASFSTSDDVDTVKEVLGVLGINEESATLMAMRRHQESVLQQREGS